MGVTQILVSVVYVMGIIAPLVGMSRTLFQSVQASEIPPKVNQPTRRSDKPQPNNPPVRYRREKIDDDQDRVFVFDITQHNRI